MFWFGHNHAPSLMNERGYPCEASLEGHHSNDR
jgi:hypothetical protein